MENWPTVPLIRIIRGKYREFSVENVVAVKTSKGGCYMEVGGGRDFSPNRDSDAIDDWEPVTPVPTRLLKDLEKAWSGPGGEGCNWLRTVEDALHPLLQVNQLYLSREN